MLASASCDAGQAAAPSITPVVVVPPRDFASGSRLRARIHRVDDAVDVLAAFHDVMLDADCAFEDEQGPHVGPGQSSYCVPARVARHREGKGPYLDASCTEPAAFPPSVGAATIALVDPRDACSTAPVARVAEAAAPRRTFLFDENGVCREAPRGPLQRLGAVLPDTTFVRAVEATEPRAGSRLEARVLAGVDGSRVVVGGFDRRRAEAVRIGDLGDGTRRWLPARLAFVGSGEPLFGDAACAPEYALAAKIGRTATCPISAAFVFEGLCGGGTVRVLGERAPMTFAKREKGCSSVAVNDSLVFALGDVVPASTFVRVIEAEIGGPRLRRLASSGEDGDVVSWGRLVDAELGGGCVVDRALDGELRCLPEAAESVSLFADDACTEPAFAHSLTGCETGWPRFVRDVSVDPRRAFVVGRALPTAFTMANGACKRFVPLVESRIFAASFVAPERFLRAEERVE